jgi:hypothetical protein
MTPVTLTPDEAAVLLQSLDATARSGQIDATIRQGGINAVASFAALAEKLRAAAKPVDQQQTEADMEAKDVE